MDTRCLPYTGVYEVAPSSETPYIRLDPTTGIFVFSGKSMPSNPFTVYDPVLSWLRHYAEEPAEETVLKFQMHYYNTSTSKVILQIIGVLETIQRQGQRVEIQWIYNADDEDMEEAGYEFAENTILPFTLIPNEE